MVFIRSQLKKYLAIAESVTPPLAAAPAAAHAAEPTLDGSVSTQKAITDLEAELAQEGLSLIETETIFVAGYGNIEVTYDFLTETLTMVDEHGEREVVTFEELGEILTMAMQAQQASTTPGQVGTLNSNPICEALVTGTGEIHQNAWQRALRIAGVNPYVRLAVSLGEAGLWRFLKSNC